jgi:hypothetical protein
MPSGRSRRRRSPTNSTTAECVGRWTSSAATGHRSRGLWARFRRRPCVQNAQLSRGLDPYSTKVPLGCGRGDLDQAVAAQGSARISGSPSSLGVPTHADDGPPAPSSPQVGRAACCRRVAQKRSRCTGDQSQTTYGSGRSSGLTPTPRCRPGRSTHVPLYDDALISNWAAASRKQPTVQVRSRSRDSTAWGRRSSLAADRPSGR